MMFQKLIALTLRLYFPVVALMLFTACGGGSSSGGEPEPPPPPTNNAPIVSGDPDLNVDAGNSYSFTPTASDSDGDMLTFSITNSPGWASFDTTNGTLSGKPVDSDIGSYNDIVISVSDGKGGNASLSPFTLIVDPALPTIQIKEVSSTSPALIGTSLSLENYLTVTLLSSNTMDASGNATTDFVDTNKGQMLFISNDNDEPIAVAYFSSEQIQQGNADITFESLADGIIMSNPLMMGYEASDRESLLEEIKSSIDYSSFVEIIESVLIESPTQLLDSHEYPEVFESSIDLIITAIDGLGGNSLQVLQSMLQPMNKTNISMNSFIAPDPLLGNEDGPYLADVDGENILAVNPTMVFYGIELEGQDTQLIAGKEAAFALLDKAAAEPVEEEIFMGDGNYEILFTKNALNTSGGRLSAGANTLKIACLFLDAWAYCPVSNSTIEATIETDVSAADVFNMWGEDIIGDLPKKAAGELFEYFAEQIVSSRGNQWMGEITRRLYKNTVNVDGAVKFFKNGKAVLKVATKMLKIYSAAQKYIPFAWDFVTSPIQRGWCITQDQGVLSPSATCSRLPPSAAFSISPTSSIEGQIVYFDASSSTDPIYSSGSLEYQWDFNGDGFIDTGWSTESTSTFSYESAGVFSTLLYVRNPDGIEDVAQQDINVLSSSAGSFEDDFSGDLSAWTEYSDNNWSIVNDELRGEYSLSCGSVSCPQADLILKDEFQVPGDWGASFDFIRVADSSISNYYAAWASFSLWENSNSKLQIGFGDAGTNWGGGTQDTIKVSIQHWNGSWSSLVNEDITHTWDTSIWHKARLEKSGSTYLLYFDDTLIHEFSDTVLNGTGKIGLHTYGTKRYDNFVLQ